MTRTCKYCKSTDVTLREVTYSNGAKHLRQECPCGRSYNVPTAGSVNRDALYAHRVLQRRYGDSFYTGLPWLELRYAVLATQARCCALCGSAEKPLHVDHIKPRSKYPKLELDINNLQILRWRCNKGKGANDEQDFREEQP